MRLLPIAVCQNHYTLRVHREKQLDSTEVVGLYPEHMSKLHDKAYLPQFLHVSRRLCSHSAFVLFD